MKIAITGMSGSGKSTLSRRLSELYQIPVLHLDSVHHTAGWNERDPEEEKNIVRQFLNSHNDWVIDGNYRRLDYERRMSEADLILQMRMNRFLRLFRVWKRYRTYRGTTRPDMADNCPEKLDRDFAIWVLWKGCGSKAIQLLNSVSAKYPGKTVILNSQRKTELFFQREQEKLASRSTCPHKGG